MEFSSRLYELRKAKGLSQEELANKLNVSRQTVSKWELGDSTPDMEKLTAISDLFEISLDQLVLGKAPASGDTSSKAEDIFFNLITTSFNDFVTRIENTYKDIACGGGLNWEIGTDIYTLVYMK